MKVTNFEISKKLKEIGFEEETNYGWHKDNLESGPAEFPLSKYAFNTNYIKAYDLETLLDFLPKSINTNTCSFEEYLQLNIDQMSYQNAFSTNYICVDREENESLADVAGRLLILLHEKEIIK